MINAAFDGAFGFSFIFIFVNLFLLMLFLAGSVVLILGLLLNRIKSFKQTKGAGSLRKVFIGLGSALCIPLPLLFSIFFFYSLYQESKDRKEMGDYIYAMSHENIGMFKRAIRRDEPVNSEFVHYGSTSTPLIYACNNSTAEFVEMLLENGADPQQKLSDTGINPLWAAISSNDNDITNLLIKSGADASSERDGETLLHIALYFKADKEIFSLLLDAGADVDGQDPENGKTPVMTLISSCGDSLESIDDDWVLGILSVLSDYDADVYSIQDDLGKTAWDYVQDNPECGLNAVIGNLFPK